MRITPREERPHRGRNPTLEMPELWSILGPKTPRRHEAAPTDPVPDLADRQTLPSRNRRAHGTLFPPCDRVVLGRGTTPRPRHHDPQTDPRRRDLDRGLVPPDRCHQHPRGPRLAMVRRRIDRRMDGPVRTYPRTRGRGLRRRRRHRFRRPAHLAQHEDAAVHLPRPDEHPPPPDDESPQRRRPAAAPTVAATHEGPDAGGRDRVAVEVGSVVASPRPPHEGTILGWPHVLVHPRPPPQGLAAPRCQLKKGSGREVDGLDGNDTPEAIHTFLPITR